jgi:long-chain fatty acid transport protein
MHRPRMRLAPAVLAAATAAGWALLAASGAGAQPVTIPRFDFSFSNPGARSLGFAGAFAALADDATAAYANPAGLVQLTRPEVSFEARLWSRSPSYLAGGRVEGEPTGEGIDTRPGLVFARDHSQTSGPSFASVVIPKGRWSFALYGHKLANFRERTEHQGLFFTDEEGFVDRSPGARETASLDIDTAGVAAGWRMNDHFSFGLGLVFSDASLKTRSEGFVPDDDSRQSFFGRISFLPERRLSLSSLALAGTDLTANAGMLWRVSEQLSAGLFYRQGATVNGTADFAAGPAATFQFSARNRVTLKIPDVAGTGLAYRSSGGRVTLASEIDRVRYTGFLRVHDSDTLIVAKGHYVDAWEYHVGGEYALLQAKPILALRVGYWAEANDNNLGQGRVDHVTAGLGIAAPAVQIDLAGDLSEEGNRFALSLIYDF